MRALLQAEVLKLRTTRAAYVYLFLLVALSALLAAANATAAHLLDLEDPAFQRDLVSESVAAPLIALMLGIVSVTAEWRHGTITRTLLLSPRRWRVLAAKEINAFVLGIGLALVGLVVTIAVAAPILSRDGTPLHVDVPFAVRMLQIILASALWGAIGAGVGTLVQHQAGALVAAILWILLVESLLTVLVDWLDLAWIGDLFPRHALNSLAGHESGMSAGAGAAVGVGYVAVFAAIAFLRIRRQDIT